MNALELTGLITVSAFAAGFLGALTGLGGGVVIVPLLTVAFGVDIRYAIGASLICVIATSSAAAVAYVKQRLTNIRVGIFLEVATTVGAVVGAWLGTRSPTAAIAIVFGCVLLFSAYQSVRARDPSLGLATSVSGDSLGSRLRLDSTYPAAGGSEQWYFVQRVPLGFALMFVAGILSALLGIGSGAVKVLAMDRAMGLPFRVSTTTSNFMIGVTAAASVGFYLRGGYIDPELAMPVVLGVAAGAFLGARLLQRIAVPLARRIFAILVVALGVEMIYQALTGRIA